MSVVNPQKRNLDLARSDKKEDEIKKDKITNSNAVSFLFFLSLTNKKQNSLSVLFSYPYKIFF